jgi:2-polyprenyl-3-methyl-5-hydroxy-6-metoxy-1,4-benzoquinol methylase
MISESYREEQARLHENDDYGVASTGYADFVSSFINQMGITEMLDYGAGKGRLAKSLKVNHDVEVRHYDPAIPEWSKKPDSAQLVCCLDVLEHIEPEFLDDVLDDLQRVVEFYGIFSIHTHPAKKTLSDGRNAHLTQAPSAWWMPKIQQRFDLMIFQSAKKGFLLVVKKYGD